MITATHIARTLTATGAALLLACGGQQTTPDAKMTPEPMATAPMSLAPVQPLAEVESTATAGRMDAMQLRVEQSLTRAASAIGDAREAGADLYASETLQKSIDQLRTAEQYRDSGQVLDAIARANMSANTAIAAHNEARPHHVLAVAKAMQRTDALNLMADLSVDPTTKPLLTDDGIIVAVVGAYLPLDESLSEAGRQKLSGLADVAQKYATFDLILSASSSDDKSATNSLLMGQNRALSAEKFLQAKGIARERVKLTGRVGEEGRTLWVRFIPDTRAALKKTQVTGR